MDYEEETGEDGFEKPEKPMGSLRWLILLSIAIIVDVFQFVLNWLLLTLVGAAIPLIVNRVIDIIFALLLLFYLKWRKVDLNFKAWISICSAFIAEMIPIVDSFPLWSLDVVYLWAINGNGVISTATTTVIGKRFSRSPQENFPPVITKTPENATGGNASRAQYQTKNSKGKDLNTAPNKQYGGSLVSNDKNATPRSSKDIANGSPAREQRDAKQARVERFQERQSKTPQYGREIQPPEER